MHLHLACIIVLGKDPEMIYFRGYFTSLHEKTLIPVGLVQVLFVCDFFIWFVVQNCCHK